MSLEQSVLWHGKQWRVTNEGLETTATDGEHVLRIPKAELARGSADLYASWPVHMAQKVWVDFDDFVKAFLAACVIHGIRIENVFPMVDTARHLHADLELKRLRKQPG